MIICLISVDWLPLQYMQCLDFLCNLWTMLLVTNLVWNKVLTAGLVASSRWESATDAPVRSNRLGHAQIVCRWRCPYVTDFGSRSGLRFWIEKDHTSYCAFVGQKMQHLWHGSNLLCLCRTKDAAFVARIKPLAIFFFERARGEHFKVRKLERPALLGTHRLHCIFFAVTYLFLFIR
jgi:hypothetical protein